MNPEIEVKETRARSLNILFWALNAGGLFTLFMSLPLAFPVLFEVYLEFMWQMNLQMGLGGNPIVVPEDGGIRLFINHAGVELVSLSILILYAARNPVERRFIIYLTMAGRLLFALYATYYTVHYEGIELFYFIVGADITILGFIIYGIVRARHILHPTRFN